jgi:hypothetical protein
MTNISNTRAQLSEELAGLPWYGRLWGHLRHIHLATSRALRGVRERQDHVREAREEMAHLIMQDIEYDNHLGTIYRRLRLGHYGNEAIDETYYTEDYDWASHHQRLAGKVNRMRQNRRY